MKKLLLFLLLPILIRAQIQDLNLDFEYWVDSTLVNDEIRFQDPTIEHKVKDPYIGQPVHWKYLGNSIHRTSDSHSGKYAIALHSWHYGHAVGSLKMGACESDFGPCLQEVKMKLKSIIGFYKLNVQDTMGPYDYPYTSLHLGLYKNEILLKAYTYDFEATDIYKPFNLKIDEGIDIDSYSIIIYSSKGCKKGEFCNFLYLDDLRLEFAPNGNEEVENESVPFLIIDNNKIKMFRHVGISHLNLYDINGRILKAIEPKTQDIIDLADYPTGLYLLTWQDTIIKNFFLKQYLSIIKVTL